MKYLFDIEGTFYEVELNSGETKKIEYRKGSFVKVTLRKIVCKSTEDEIGYAFLRLEFDNGNILRSKDAVIAKISNF